MKELEDRILKEGKVLNNSILKVDAFVNHQIDTKLARSIAKHMVAHFPKPDRILTIETSGIVFAAFAAQELGDIPMVFARKTKTSVLSDDCYYAELKSFTRNLMYTCAVDKRFLPKGERVLIVDDVLAEGNASLGLIKMLKEAGCEVVGLAVVFEKRFQGGRAKLEEMGVPVYAAADIERFENNVPVFHREGSPLGN